MGCFGVLVLAMDDVVRSCCCVWLVLLMGVFGVLVLKSCEISVFEIENNLFYNLP